MSGGPVVFEATTRRQRVAAAVARLNDCPADCPSCVGTVDELMRDAAPEPPAYPLPRRPR